MDPSSLTQFYNDLKTHEDMPKRSISFDVKPNANGMMGPGATIWRNKCVRNCNKLKDDCRKQIIIDIYTKTLPLDKDYIDGNMGQMDKDVDCMLATKGMTPTQYLTSCSEATGAPFVDYLLWATSKIGESYMMEADKQLKDAQKLDAELPEPKEPSVEDQNVQQQLVDIKQDPEYEDFIEKLKKKTINKIVADISNIINDKKEEKDMTFNSAPPPVEDELPPEPAQESVLFEARRNSEGFSFKSELEGFKSFETPAGSKQNGVANAAKKLVALDKEIKKSFYNNIRTLIKTENKERSSRDKLPVPRSIMVLLGDNEKMVKTSSLFRTNTKRSARRFIKNLIKEYKSNSASEWSKKCAIWISVQYVVDTKEMDEVTKKKVLELNKKALQDSLSSHIKARNIKIESYDVKKETVKVRGTINQSSIYDSPTAVGTETFSTMYRFYYTVSLNMKYIFSDISKEDLDKYSEAVDYMDRMEAQQMMEDYRNRESTVGVPLDYINQIAMKENVDIDPDEAMGLAIREATLHELDLVFKQKGSDFNEYSSNIRYDKGYVANEHGVSDVVESKKEDEYDAALDKTYKDLFGSIKDIEKETREQKNKTDENLKKMKDSMNFNFKF